MVNKGQPGGQPLYQPDGRASGVSDGWTGGRATDVSTPFSSSSLESLEKLTTKAVVDVMCDPEFFYWKDEGVDSRQMEAWLTEFGMDTETLFSSLCHARFDILAKIDGGMGIPSPKGYFYNTAKRYGGMYPMPKGYKPLRLINAEIVQKRRLQEAEAARIESEIGEIPDEVKAFTGWMPKSSQKHPGQNSLQPRGFAFGCNRSSCHQFP